jgi:hypothetical protein
MNLLSNNKTNESTPKQNNNGNGSSSNTSTADSSPISPVIQQQQQQIHPGMFNQSDFLFLLQQQQQNQPRAGGRNWAAIHEGRVIADYGGFGRPRVTEQDIETLKSCLIKGWVNCLIKEKKNKVEGKATHYLEIDNWKPTEPFKKDNETKTYSNETKYTPKIEDDGLPF